MKTNIKLALASLSNLRVLALLRQVVSMLTGNLFFPTPIVPLADMTLLADELEDAIKKAKSGDRVSIAERNILVDQAKEMLTSQADYVRAVSKGNRPMLLSSGFELSKERERYGIPLAPEKLSSRATKLSHEVEVRWPKATGILGHRVFMTDQDPVTNPTWEYVDFTSRTSFVFKGLESYKAYWFSVTSINSAGESELSKPILGRAA
jgi:hypothetical protein